MADRIVCLGLFAFRGRLEGTLQQTSWIARLFGESEVEGVVASIAELGKWLEQAGLEGSLSPSEQRAMEQPPASWQRDTVLAAAHAEEAVGVLAWALGLVPEVPPYDSEFSGRSLLGQLPFQAGSAHVGRHDASPSEQHASFVAHTALRASALLEAERQRAELWRWRAKLRQRGDDRVRRGVPSEEVTARLEAAASRGEVDPLLGDFPAFGRPYGKIGRQELKLALRIADARLQALVWLTQPETGWEKAATTAPPRPG